MEVRSELHLCQLLARVRTFASAALVAACLRAFSPDAAWVGTGCKVLMALDNAFKSLSMDSN